MKYCWLAFVLGTLGCHPLGSFREGCAHDAPATTTHRPVSFEQVAEPAVLTPAHLDLPALWSLAVEHNPELREAAAGIEAARGELAQAGVCPNPRFDYGQDVIGARVAPQGNIRLAVHQEIVTAGKRGLDREIAARGLDQAAVDLNTRRHEILTRLRRSYFDYVNLLTTSQVNSDTVASLEEAIRLTRQLVEKAKTRPQTDLLALETLLEETKIIQAKTRAALATAWKQLAAEIGLPKLSPPQTVIDLKGAAPQWQEDVVVGRVLAANTALARARLEADSARLTVERARAEAVPNVTVGGGYTLENLERTAGGMVSVETPLPLWDKKQGMIRAAQGRAARAQAAVRSAETKLQRETADAWGRYHAARQNVERLGSEVLPRLEKRRQLLRQAYQAGAAQVSFSDILLIEQSLLAGRLSLAEARRELWRAIADLQGLMQLDVGENP